MSILMAYSFDPLYMAGLVYMGLTVGAFVMLLSVILMHFLMPVAVLDCYWKEPYFRPAELAFFTDTIYAPMRTVMLMWVIAFPRFGRKRGIATANSLVPRWYRVVAKAISVWIVVGAASMLAVTVGVFAHGYITDNPVPLVRDR